MKIFFESTENLDCFYFFEKNITPEISLNFPMKTEEVILIFQCSLDLLKCVVVFCNFESINKFSFANSKKKHIDLLRDEYIFLNFSIRNKLEEIKFQDKTVNNFNDLYQLLNK